MDTTRLVKPVYSVRTLAATRVLTAVVVIRVELDTGEQRVVRRVIQVVKDLCVTRQTAAVCANKATMEAVVIKHVLQAVLLAHVLLLMDHVNVLKVITVIDVKTRA